MPIGLFPHLWLVKKSSRDTARPLLSAKGIITPELSLLESIRLRPVLDVLSVILLDLLSSANARRLLGRPSESLCGMSLAYVFAAVLLSADSIGVPYA